MNLILLLVVISEVCIGICAWLSPQWLRAVAAHLLTRADVLDLVRTEEQRRMRFWMSEFGLAGHSKEEMTDSRTQVAMLARR